VIGKEGIKIKQIGENARKEIEKYFENKKVFLNLIVKVKKD
jgi:GTP-binding protein Era